MKDIAGQELVIGSVVGYSSSVEGLKLGILDQVTPSAHVIVLVHDSDTLSGFRRIHLSSTDRVVVLPHVRPSFLLIDRILHLKEII
jgi:hypothetical protein